MAKKTDQAEKLYHEALDALDAVHSAIVEFADLCGAEQRPPLITDDGGKLPRSVFVADGEEEPERGGIAFDTRMALSLTAEQAEALAFELLRALREDHPKELELELDGRFMLKRGAASDVRNALDDVHDRR
jgi:hypothetical protein